MNNPKGSRFANWPMAVQSLVGANLVEWTWLRRPGVIGFNLLPEQVDETCELADVGNVVTTNVPVLFSKQ